MNNSVFTPAEIKYLWKHRGNNNYKLKTIRIKGNNVKSLIFEDIRNYYEVSGKILVSPEEGEAYHWPRLQHENLAPLLDIISINETISIYMSTVFEKSLRSIIQENEFIRRSDCLQRKKAYAEDILKALDYLHSKRLCLMNLNDENIYVSSCNDKAIITDFSSLMLEERATKNQVGVPTLYRAPEINVDLSERFNAKAAEMWACGVIMLQIFSGHVIYSYSGDAVNYVLRMAENVSEKLEESNVQKNKDGCNVINDFKRFLDLFLKIDPSSRTTAANAIISPFLQNNQNGGNQRFGDLWSRFAYKAEQLYRKDDTDSLKIDACELSPHHDKFKYIKGISTQRRNSQPCFGGFSLEYASNQEKLNDEAFRLSLRSYNTRPLQKCQKNKADTPKEIDIADGTQSLKLPDLKKSFESVNSTPPSQETSIRKNPIPRIFYKINQLNRTKKTESEPSFTENRICKAYSAITNSYKKANDKQEISFGSSTGINECYNLSPKNESKNSKDKSCSNERDEQFDEHKISNLAFINSESLQEQNETQFSFPLGQKGITQNRGKLQLHRSNSDSKINIENKFPFTFDKKISSSFNSFPSHGSEPWKTNPALEQCIECYNKSHDEALVSSDGMQHININNNTNSALPHKIECKEILTDKLLAKQENIQRRYSDSFDIDSYCPRDQMSINYPCFISSWKPFLTLPRSNEHLHMITNKTFIDEVKFQKGMTENLTSDSLDYSHNFFYRNGDEVDFSGEKEALKRKTIFEDSISNQLVVTPLWLQTPMEDPNSNSNTLNKYEYSGFQTERDELSINGVNNLGPLVSGNFDHLISSGDRQMKNIFPSQLSLPLKMECIQQHRRRHSFECAMSHSKSIKHNKIKDKNSDAKAISSSMILKSSKCSNPNSELEVHELENSMCQKVEKQKRRFKIKRHKKRFPKTSWFQHLCPGCQLYSEDTEILFSEIQP